MKKITFYFYITLISLFIFPQNFEAQEFKIDSVQIFIWNNPLPDDWSMQTRRHHTFDNGGINATNVLFLIKDNSTSEAWLNNLQIIITYTAQDKIESTTILFWIGTSWTNTSKTVYSYDGSGNNDVTTNYGPNGAGWLENSRTVMTYNSSDLITERIYQSGNTSSWTNTSRVVYTYSEDKITEDYYDWNVTEWSTTINTRTVSNYNSTLLIDITTLIDNSGVLENQGLSTYIYNGNNLDIVTYYSWDGSVWVASSRSRFTFDVNNTIIELIFELWSSPDWVSSQKSVYFSSEAALNISSNNLLKGKVYPNPFNNELNISLKTPLENEGTLQIFDMHGKEISKTELNQGVKTIKLNNPYLAKGIYFIQIISASQNHTFKVIKQ